VTTLSGTSNFPIASSSEAGCGGIGPVVRSATIALRRRAEPDEICCIGPAARQIVEAFERVLKERKSESLLVWPQRPDGIAVFHSLAALNRMSQCDREGFTTAFFPWSRNTGGTQRTVLVDRDELVKSTLPPLNRVLPNGGKDRAFAYLMALHSLKHLLSSGKANTKWKKKLNIDKGLLHPTLYEIMPQIGILSASIKSYADQFLRRLRRLTWIDERADYIEAANHPMRTPFFLFGIHAEAKRQKIWREAGLDPAHGGTVPDIILLDLTRRARNRIGDKWRQAVSTFLGSMEELYGLSCPPALALTDDVFVLQALRWGVLRDHDLKRGFAKKSRSPPPARLILSPRGDLLAQDTIIRGTLSEVTAEVYGADILSFVDFGFKLRRSLAEADASEIADAVGTAIEVIQSLIGLPGHPKLLFDFIAENYEGTERDNLQSRYDHLAPRGRIKSALQLGLAGAQHDQLSQFLVAYDKLCAVAANHNPGAQLFDDCVRGLLRKGTRSILVFSSELLRGFAEWRIESDAAFADARDLAAKKLRLVDRREAIEELDLDQKEQQLFQRIVFIEPHVDDFLHVLTRPWLPEKVILLAHLARAEHALRRIRILLQLEGVDAIAEKLRAIETELVRALDGRTIDIPDSDAAPRLPRLGTLDLTTTTIAGAGPPRIIHTSGDLKIRAFDGSDFALYDSEALQVFSRRSAKDLQPGDQVCVFSPDFIDAAREKLNLTVNASDVLALYHKDVAQAVERLPGADMTAKAAALKDRILKNDPTLSLPGLPSIRDWIDVLPLIDAPRDEVRPHAPRDRRHYLCLMKALGISDDIARHYWDFGIFWTRSMRIRKGAEFHQVFLGILVDPHGAASRLPDKRRHDIWRIYETAEHHIVTVLSNEREGASA
jgi:hypothetical protein